MQTKPLLYGIGGFMLGGLVVSLAATLGQSPISTDHGADVSMTHEVESLKTKKGDAFDKAFLKSMKLHHQDAIDMARLSETNAQRQEIKKLSSDIIAAQQKEINDMTQWEKNW